MKNKFLTTVIALTMTLGFTMAQGKAVDTKTSKVTWKGYKVTGSHEGVVNLKDGTLNFENDKLVGGEFTVDMTSLTSTDLEGEWQQKLDGHLKSDDFFGVAAHPEAKLTINEAKANGKNSYTVSGDITIKGTTEPVSFDLSVYGSKATAALKLDRTKFGLKYGSGSFFDNLGDKTIYDEFDLVVDLQF